MHPAVIWYRMYVLDRMYAFTVGGAVIIAAELAQGATNCLMARAPGRPRRTTVCACHWRSHSGPDHAQVAVAATRPACRASYICGLGAMALAALFHPFVFLFC